MVLRATDGLDFNRIYSPEEFEGLPEFNDHYELLDGRLVKKAVPGDEHFRIIMTLILAFSRFDPQQRFGTFWSQTSIAFGKGWIPLPDFAFMTANRVPPKSPGSVKGVPDLVVEVHSPSDLESKPRRDAAQNKIKEYQSYGVKIIWTINPASKTVEVYHPGQAQPVLQLGVRQILNGENVVPGFELPVADLF